MKRKNDFTDGCIAKHDAFGLSSTMHFVFKLVFLSLFVLINPSI